MQEYWKESYLEGILRDELIKLGGVAWKFTSPGTRGVPDRIILLPGARIIFLEMKSTGYVPSKLQLYIHRLLRNLGFRVEVIDNRPDLIKFIESL